MTKTKYMFSKAKAKDMTSCPRGQGHGLEDSISDCCSSADETDHDLNHNTKLLGEFTASFVKVRNSRMTISNSVDDQLRSTNVCHFLD